MPLKSDDLRRLYPEMSTPIRCENGCGAVIECGNALQSYNRDTNGNPQLICQCCASEIGHLYEDMDEPEDAPVCKRKMKTDIGKRRKKS